MLWDVVIVDEELEDLRLLAALVSVLVAKSEDVNMHMGVTVVPDRRGFDLPSRAMTNDREPSSLLTSPI